MQDKLLLTRRPDGSWARPLGGVASTHLLKPQPATFPDLVELEAFGLHFAGALGADAARAEVLAVEGRPVLAVERYDRHVDPDGRVTRVHQEDFCQACGRLPEQKYQVDGGPGWADVAAVLRAVAADPREQLLALVRALVVTVLLGNADAHARNLSLLHPLDGPRLAPLYDLVPTVHLTRVPGAPPLDERMAMSVHGRWGIRDVTRVDVLAETRNWPVPRRLAAAVVDECVERAVAFCRARPEAVAARVGEEAERLR